MEAESRHERVTRLAIGALSDEQRKVFLGASDRIVTACPGSGKTRGIAARAATQSASGRRVALVSFTNVGADEMRDAIRRDYDMDLGLDCFTGTIHRYLLRYVYRPFAREVMGAVDAPTVRVARSPQTVSVGRYKFDVDDFEFEPDGGVRYVGWKPRYKSRAWVAEQCGRQAVVLKIAEARTGIVTNSDALYWAFQAVSQEPVIASALSERFDEVIIDEAQDTSSMQTAILRKLLIPESSQSLFLVGDFDQSIYSFQGASPSLVKSLAAEAGLESIPLKENYRSSQLICNVTSRLRSQAVPDRAVGLAKDADISPELFFYDPANIATLGDSIEERLRRRGIDTQRSAVLVRSNRLLQELSGGSGELVKKGSALEGLLGLARNGLPNVAVSQLQRFEDILLDELRTQGVSGVSRGELRSVLVAVLESIANKSHLSTRDWAALADHTLWEGLREVGAVEIRGSALFTGGADEMKRVASEYLGTPRALEVQLSTVHGVKGRSLDGVVAVADYVDPEWGTAEWVQWKDYLSNHIDAPDAIDDEGYRILYVALTRAERGCYVALPLQADRPGVRQVFESAGFLVGPAE